MPVVPFPKNASMFRITILIAAVPMVSGKPQRKPAATRLKVNSVKKGPWVSQVIRMIQRMSNRCSARIGGEPSR